MIGQEITLDGYDIAGIIIVWTAVVMLAVGVAHQVGLNAEATSVPVADLEHDRCEGCGRDVCGHDTDAMVTCPGTVLAGCVHQRALCTDCMTECGSCRDDLAISAYVWGESL